MADGSLQLQADVPELSDLYEIQCSVSDATLQCSPWPEVGTTIDDYRYSSLSIVFTAPETLNIAASSWLSTDAIESFSINTTLVHTLDQ